jgi:hypothetical protein
MDPSILKSLSKRKRHEDDDLAKPTTSKPATFALKVISSTKPTTTPSKRHENRSHTPSNSISLPTSAPAAAGRSPKSKNRVGILNRRRNSSTPFKRIDPPVFTKPTSNGGFSIAAALSGTIPSRKSKLSHTPVRTIEESMPKSWMFDIHEDSEHEELSNLLGHSTQTLDISDDESKAEDKNDRGKENIPPAELGLAVPVPSAAPSTRIPVSRKDMMTDEPRTPLGDLNAADFYAEGCDESSYFVYPAEDNKATYAQPFDFTNQTVSKNDIAALIQATAPKDIAQDEQAKIDGAFPLPSTLDTDVADTEIEIWESGSAKDEAEAGSPRDNIFAM